MFVAIHKLCMISENFDTLTDAEDALYSECMCVRKSFEDEYEKKIQIINQIFSISFYF